MVSTLYTDPTKAGRLKSGTPTNPDNYFDGFTGICDTCEPATDACNDSVLRVLTVAEKASTFTGVNIAGIFMPFSTPISTTDFEAVRRAVAVEFLKKENDVIVYGKYDSTASTLMLAHNGLSTLNSLVLAGGATIAFTRKCTYSKVCASKTSVVGAVTPLVYNGVTTTLTAAAWTATPATNAATATTLKNEIAAALGAGFTVTVTANTATSQYDIQIDSAGYFTGTVGGNIFENCGCSGMWS